ncbi:hypothetical protein [Geitlerinema sp. PCC 9228]|jgi:hypothetical protein|uniref:hypothetical protein n=1 Tax=Geitlerinema sp. PCC 9228 TaxID=111611 RepID=UPI0008F996C9|nr:hypothetical protein [Geitlerinema sp. PCC 9228]
MSVTITNLTLHIIDEEIDAALYSRRCQSSGVTVQNGKIREQLRTYVLQQVQPCYAVMNENDDENSPRTLIPHQLRHQVKSAVRQKLRELLAEDNWYQSQPTSYPLGVEAEQAPSSWFG